MREFSLSAYDASVLSVDKDAAEFFDEVAISCDPKLAANWITGEFFGRLNKNNQSIYESKINAEKLVGLIRLIMDNTISGKIAKDVFDQMFETGQDAQNIVKEKGLEQITDTSAIEGIINKILTDNQDKVEQYKSGKDKLFGFFVGQTMKDTGGKANPQVVNDILKKKLS